MKNIIKKILNESDWDWVRDVPDYKEYNACEIIDQIKEGDFVYLTGTAYYLNEETNELTEEVHFSDARGVVILKRKEVYGDEVFLNYFDVKMDERFFEEEDYTDEVTFECTPHIDDLNVKNIKIRLEKPLDEDLKYWGVRGNKMGPLKEEEEMDGLSWIRDVDPYGGVRVGDVLESLIDMGGPSYPMGMRKGEKVVVKRITYFGHGYQEFLVSTIPFKGLLKGDTAWIGSDTLKYFKNLTNKRMNENISGFGSGEDEVTSLKGHRGYEGWVFIHRNLNRPPYYSIKAGKSGGPVIGYDTDIYLKDVIFKVQKGGQKRVRKEMRKNVHAGVVGKIVDSGGDYDTTGWTLVTYNPYQHDSFVEYETGKPIYNAKEVVMKNEKEVWAR
jgi:hypothetical protein